MLDAYCHSLSDEAQLKIAIRLGNMAMPVWDKYIKENPTALDKINALFEDAIKVKGGAGKIDAAFPARALEKIERSWKNARENNSRYPVAAMKSDATLSPMLATIMHPLTNPQWDNILPQSVKLAYTLVFNILVWILYRRRTDQNETHVYVAINQAIDTLLRESILPSNDINKILQEYQQQTRGASEDEEWENAFPVGESEELDKEDIYRKMIGEKVHKDIPDHKLAKEVLRQMREEGKSYRNELDEYNTGTRKTYSYNTEKKSFWRSEFDVIVGSFHNEYAMTEGEMLSFISGQSLFDLRSSNFEI